MKLIATIPDSIQVSEVVGALRKLGLEVRYSGGELTAKPQQQGNVIPLRSQIQNPFMVDYDD